MDDVKREIECLDNDGDRDEIYTAMLRLRDMGERAVAPLITVLLDQNKRPILRCRIADALGMIGDRKAVAPLISNLSDDNVMVRWNSLRALANLGDARAIPELRRLATNDTEGFSMTPQLRIVMKHEAEKAIEEIQSAAQG